MFSLPLVVIGERVLLGTDSFQRAGIDAYFKLRYSIVVDEGLPMRVRCRVGWCRGVWEDMCFECLEVFWRGGELEDWRVEGIGESQFIKDNGNPQDIGQSRESR
jgi:hypothetical protein